MGTVHVPRFRSEAVTAAAERLYRGDPEKVATTPLKGLDYHGIALSSRYSKAHEYETMMRMVDGVDPALRSMVSILFCDSKAMHCYQVTIASGCSRQDARAIALQLEAHSGGHNGICVSDGQEDYLELDPEWFEDWSA